MQQVFAAEPALQAASRGLFEKPATKFEARGRRLGHPIRELFYRRAR
jgi:hypothetical protein